MEALIAVAVLVIVILAAAQFKRPKRRGPTRTPASSPRTAPSRQTPQRAQGDGQARFDARTAAPVLQGRVISGSAWVTDGDTIKIKNTQIRLFGIDAPELDHPYGKKAKWALHKLCKGHVVQAEVLEEDEYGRTVAKCSLADGRDLSAEMVKLGLAIDWPKFSNGVYSHLEPPDARKKLFLADARQKGRKFLWDKYEKRKRET